MPASLSTRRGVVLSPVADDPVALDKDAGRNIARLGEPRIDGREIGIDGRAQQRTCLLPVAEGMEVRTRG